MANSKRKRRKRRDSLVLQLLILVAVVLTIFEGRLIFTMIRHSASMKETVTADSGTAAPPKNGTVSKDTPAKQKDGDSDTKLSDTGFGSVLAGLPSGAPASQSPQTEAPKKVPTVSNPDSPAIVPLRDTPVDDSYFSDAAFIGDSRMQGFQNASGITQGKFFTSVGMSLTTMQKEAVIPDPSGNITVAAALSGGTYNKIYIMLGANDLGEYDWDSFRDGFISCTKRFREIQPDAVFYICSVIYVEEGKAANSSYVNNANVTKINSILLDICEQEGYYYLDLNEFLTNGYGALAEGASSDGVHLYEKYCTQMLDYMKEHYIDVPAASKSKDASDQADDTPEKQTDAPKKEGLNTPKQLLTTQQKGLYS